VVVALKKAIPNTSHRQQVLHHATTMQATKALYVVATQTEIIYTVLIDFNAIVQVDDLNSTIIEAYEACLETLYDEYVGWCDGSSSVPDLPDWGEAKDKGAVEQALQLRKALVKLVRRGGALPAVRYIRPKAIAWWNSWKTTTDTYSEMLAWLGIPHEHLTVDQLLFERMENSYVFQLQRMDTQVQAYVWIQSDSFTDWRQYRPTVSSFSKPIADFNWMIALGLAASLDLKTEPSMTPAIKKLLPKTAVPFFDTTPGTKLRQLGRHTHAFDQGSKGHCMLCASHSRQEKVKPKEDDQGGEENAMTKMNIWTGGQPKHFCKECTDSAGGCKIFLCKKAPDGKTESCFSLWHQEAAGSLEILRTEVQARAAAAADARRTMRAAHDLLEVADEVDGGAPARKKPRAISKKAHSAQKAKVTGAGTGKGRARPASLGSGGLRQYS
jgi:hypothetical protein